MTRASQREALNLSKKFEDRRLRKLRRFFALGAKTIQQTIKWHAPDVGTVSEFMSADECAQFVKLSEDKKYEDAPVSTPDGMIIMKDVRNNERVMIDDTEIAANLYARIKLFVPPRFKKKWEPVGLNERLRFYR